MKNSTAGLSFLVVCAVSAFLLLTRVIKIFFSGIAFVIALVAIGLLSRGVRK